MTDEIKVGDTVRVSEDTPNDSYRGPIPTNMEFTVNAIGKEYAEIKLKDALLPTYFCTHTKYLVKVGGEEKEPRFKVNDVVRTVFNKITHVTSVLGNGNYYLYGMGNEYPEDSLTLVEPYTEPTEEEINISAPESVESLRIASEESHLRNFSQNIANRDYWDAYTADLAKEIAVKMLDKEVGFDLNEVAVYAVQTAKSVVEELKKK